GTERKSVAVLPFKSPKDQKHFADGLSDELINGFSQIQGVQVLARTSSFSFKNQNLDAVKIGERLRVAWVIEGEVQKSKDRLRVRARLVETETGVVEWSEEYEDRLLDDIFDVQDKITRSIIDQLGVGLLGKEEVLLEKRRGRRVKPSVYDDYLKARAAWADRFEGRLKDAMEGFEKVIKEEPGYAPAHSGLADCYTVLGWYTFMPSKVAFGAAAEFSKRALELDPSSADAHASEALIQTLLKWDWKTAEHHFSVSIDLKPTNPVVRWWHSFLLVVQGKAGEALEQGERALTEEDPFSRVIHANVGWLRHLAGDSASALTQLQETKDRWPEFALTYVFLGWVQEQCGNLDEAIQAWNDAQEQFNRFGTPMPSLALQTAHTLALMGKKQEAHAILADCDAKAALDEPVYYSPVNRAAVHVALGDIDEAMQWLARAEEIHDCWLLVLDRDPRYRPLREMRAEEFSEIVKRVEHFSETAQRVGLHLRE
ncbi:MAG: tetratricopeptide repeat protein, partial [Thermoanaerobaculia bacterium]